LSPPQNLTDTLLCVDSEATETATKSMVCTTQKKMSLLVNGCTAMVAWVNMGYMPSYGDYNHR
jgi:hypothetical protein